MNIGIIGSGKMGCGMGERWAECGHSVCFSHSRDRAGIETIVAEAGDNASLGSAVEAAQFGELVLLAVPWTLVSEIVTEVRPYLAGKTLLTCVLPWRPNQSGLALGATISAAEVIAEMAPEAHVVEALPFLADVLYAASSRFHAEAATVFYCGRHPGSKTTVAHLLVDLDFEPVDAGGLECARYLEPAAALLWHLAVHQGAGTEIALKLLRR